MRCRGAQVIVTWCIYLVVECFVCYCAGRAPPIQALVDYPYGMQPYGAVIRSVRPAYEANDEVYKCGYKGEVCVDCSSVAQLVRAW